jgi:hypothetical protein
MRAADGPDKIAEAIGAKFTAACDAATSTRCSRSTGRTPTSFTRAKQSAGDPKELRRVVTETCVKGGPKFGWSPTTRSGSTPRTRSSPRSTNGR